MGTYGGQGDWAELVELDRELGESVEAMRNAGCQLAENERAYRVRLAQRIAEERAHGMPVSVVGDVCRGDPEVADLKLSRDCSEALYKAAQEAINVRKLRVRVVSAQIEREWATVPRQGA